MTTVNHQQALAIISKAFGVPLENPAAQQAAIDLSNAGLLITSPPTAAIPVLDGGMSIGISSRVYDALVSVAQSNTLEGFAQAASDLGLADLSETLMESAQQSGGISSVRYGDSGSNRVSLILLPKAPVE